MQLHTHCLGTVRFFRGSEAFTSSVGQRERGEIRLMPFGLSMLREMFLSSVATIPLPVSLQAVFV